jgi:hypothetical protein
MPLSDPAADLLLDAIMAGTPQHEVDQMIKDLQEPPLLLDALRAEPTRFSRDTGEALQEIVEDYRAKHPSRGTLPPSSPRVLRRFGQAIDFLVGRGHTALAEAVVQAYSRAADEAGELPQQFARGQQAAPAPAPTQLTYSYVPPAPVIQVTLPQQTNKVKTRIVNRDEKGLVVSITESESEADVPAP